MKKNEHNLNNKMRNDTYNKIADEISQFVEVNAELNDINLNQKDIILKFETNYKRWFQILPYMNDDEQLVKALECYCNAVDVSPTYKHLQHMASYISHYENYNLSRKEFCRELYFKLGMTWHKLDKIYDQLAINAFKKYIFYLLGRSSHYAYSPTCYAFRKCSNYLFQSLALEQLNFSSPSTFNDPFDSPIISLLDENDEIALLMKTAYLNCVKIACFVSNIMQPFTNDGTITGKVVSDKRKKQDDTFKEYQNELMWAHYADYHKGICIKYSFPHSMTKLDSRPNDVVTYFRDVKYTKDLSVLSHQNSMTIEDAFFTKNIAWEYENELRCLLCDLNNSNKHTSIDIPGCIEAIYFGVNCNPQDIKLIKKIMQNHEFVVEEEKMIGGQLQTVENRMPIKFFQMEFDPNNFGSLVEREV